MTRTWPSFVDHDVVGLEVAVDEPRGVRGGEPAARREEHVEDLAPRARARACSQPRSVAPRRTPSR